MVNGDWGDLRRELQELLNLPADSLADLGDVHRRLEILEGVVLQDPDPVPDPEPPQEYTYTIDGNADWQRAADKVRPGDVVGIRGGTYQPPGGVRMFSRGIAGALILWTAYPGEDVLLEPGGDLGSDWQPPLVRLYAHYNKLRGIRIKNPLGRGLYVAGSHNIIQAFEAFDCGGSGINAYGDNCKFNTYEWIHSHHNYDEESGGRHADGISISSGSDNVLRFLDLHNNSDDNLDTWLSKRNLIEDAVCRKAGWDQGDGNGAKLGPGGYNTCRRLVCEDNRAGQIVNNGAPQGSNVFVDCTPPAPDW